MSKPTTSARSGGFTDHAIACLVIVLIVMPLAAFGAWTSDYLWQRGITWEQGEWVLAMMPMGTSVVFLSLRSDPIAPGIRSGLLPGFVLTGLASATFHGGIDIWFMLAASFAYGAGIGLHLIWLARNATHLFPAPKAASRVALHALPAVALYLLTADVLPLIDTISTPDGGFLVAVAASSIALILCPVTWPAKQGHRLRIDPWLALLSTVSLISFCLAFVRNVDHRKQVLSSAMLLIDGLIFAGLYLARLNATRGIKVSPRSLWSTPLRRALLSLLSCGVSALAILVILSIGNPDIDPPGSMRPEVRLCVFVISAFVAGPLLWAHVPRPLRHAFIPICIAVTSAACFGLYLTRSQASWVGFAMIAGTALGGAIACCMMRLSSLSPGDGSRNPLRLGLAAAFLGGTFGLVGAFSLMNQIYIGGLLPGPNEALPPGRPLRLAEALTVLDRTGPNDDYPSLIATSVTGSIYGSLAILCISLAVAGILATIAPPALHARWRGSATSSRG
ncbi:hypothetical protein KR767_15695 [Luteibacter anthropi]|uniref:hypothetical protein n=1 Tax=Luteibacter anthropi TaxID=564369 RepID=UPI00203277D4|nr:hypothetical protein [Luteibacter anthropi]URX61497.1 hypothetical protein KR767_15695 [Luteibacter anthropi]